MIDADMRGKLQGLNSYGHAAVLGLLTLALFLRIIVPAGWMPAADSGMRITLCTSMGAVEAWMAADGTIHKKAPDPAKSDHFCAFAALGAAFVAPESIAALPLPAIAALVLTVFPAVEVAIGQGLAAPPPPPTGPPSNL